jgi:HSP20 family protein
MLVKRNYQMPSVFDEFLNSFGSFERENYTVPAVNVKELNKEFVIEAAVPGMKKEDFKIDLNDKMLTISAEIENKDEKKEENKNGESYYRKEFCYGSFSKSYSLPDNVNAEKITAEYKDGILVVKIPKDESAKVQKLIKIN